MNLREADQSQTNDKSFRYIVRYLNFLAKTPKQRILALKGQIGKSQIYAQIFACPLVHISEL